jgi:hypothetical protein
MEVSVSRDLIAVMRDAWLRMALRDLKKLEFAQQGTYAAECAQRRLGRAMLHLGVLHAASKHRGG